MRSAILISLVFHISVYFIATKIVRISKVQFFPRQVYTVKLFSMEEASKLEAKKASPQDVNRKIERKKKPPVEAPPQQRKAKKRRRAKKKAAPSSELGPEELLKKNGESQKNESQPATGEMHLDSIDFPFGYYLVTVRRKIATNWMVPAGSSREMFCKIYFRVKRSGEIDSPLIEQSSGSFLFDQAALRAVLDASPLPPLPGGFQERYLGVHFSFAYEER